VASKASPALKVYFDACVFLAVFLEEEGRLEPASAAVRAAEQRISQGHLSALTVAEAVGAPNLRAPQGPPSLEHAKRLDQARDYFLATQFRFVDITQRASTLAMEFAVGFQLKGPDALHLALAKTSGCDELHTYDGPLLKVGTQVAGLSVREPNGDPQLEILEGL
jgi:predicted nucleic acid-binding protein